MNDVRDDHINEALKSYGYSLSSPRAKSKFNTFYFISEGDFDKAIKWTARSIHNDEEYEKRCAGHGTGYE